VAITPHTKDADARLKKELQNADIGKFKQAMKKVLKKDVATTNKQEKPE
jgi:hypothetical protein